MRQCQRQTFRQISNQNHILISRSILYWYCFTYFLKRTLSTPTVFFESIILLKIIHPVKKHFPSYSESRIR